MLDPDTYDWFRHREPVDRVAHVFHIYEVAKPSRPLDRIVQCGSPISPLDEDALEAGFGEGLDATTVRSTFDCIQGWLYPNVGVPLIVPGAVRDDSWVETRVEGVPLVFSQGVHWSHPALDIYRMSVEPESSVPPLGEMWAAPVTWSPQRILKDGVSVDAPVSTSGPLTLLGYDLDANRTEMTLTTFWRVEGGAGRPLSVMAHLIDPEGVLIEVADGLAVPIEAWQRGDIIVQRHRFESSWGYLKVGVYWLDTMEHWTIGGRDSVGATGVLIPKATE
jgi:hypothetical protein